MGTSGGSQSLKVSHKRAGVLLAALLVLVGLLWFGRGDEDDREGADGDAGRPDALELRRTNDEERDDPRLVLAGRASISGTVRELDGPPIADATVCARASSPLLSREQTREPACTTTDEQGRYRIDGLFPVRMIVGAAASRFVPDTYAWANPDDNLALRPGEHREGVDVVLEGGAVEITGIVQDLGGGEIEGARIWTSAQSGTYFGMTSRTSAVPVLSDADGRFSAWVRPGETSVSGEAEGYTDASASGAAPGHVFELHLAPESVLVGKVVDAESGSPVPDARVYTHGDWNGGWSDVTYANEEGRFRIDRLDSGQYKPSAETDRSFGMADHSVALGLGETSEEIVIRVHPAFLVEGSLIQNGGDPCRSGGVSLSDKAQDLERRGESQPDGTVRIAAVLPGTYSVHVWCRGAHGKRAYDAVVVADAPLSGVTWEVDPGFTLTGIVVDDSGKGVARAQVFANGKSTDPAMQSGASATSGRDGSFTLRGLRAGIHEVSAVPNGTGHPTPLEPVEVDLLADRDTPAVRITLEAGSGVHGRVIDDRGAPVAGVQVRASPIGAPGRGSASTRDDGTFEIKGLRPGIWRVTASQAWTSLRKPGSGDDDVQGERVTVEAGRFAEVELTIERKDGKITGRVLDDDGGPVADAHVTVQRESESAAASATQGLYRVRWGGIGSRPIVSDIEGRFSAEGLSPGKYTVHAARKGGGEGTLEHVEVGSEVVVRFDPGGTISGRVVLTGGGFPARFTVNARAPASGAHGGESYYRSNGEFTIEGLPAGTYEINASSPEGSAKVENLELKTGEDHDGIVLEIQGKGSIRGRIVSLEDGSPIPGMMVIASGSGGFSASGGDFEGGKHISDAEGNFELDHVPSGRVHLLVWSATSNEDYGEADTQAEVQTGEVTDVGSIRLAKRRTDKGKTTGDLGLSLAQGDPNQKPEETPIKIAVVRPGGPAQRAGVRPGDIVISVDGHDVQGANRYLYWSLTLVTEGTKVRFGLKSGRSVEIVAGPKP